MTEKKQETVTAESISVTESSPLKRKAEEGKVEEMPEPKSVAVVASSSSSSSNGNASKKLKGKISRRYEDVPEDEDEEDEEEEEEEEGNEEVDDEDDEDSLEEIDSSNIIHGSRTRGKVIDFQKAAEKLDQEGQGQSKNAAENEDDEDNDADFLAPIEEE